MASWYLYRRGTTLFAAALAVACSGGASSPAGTGAGGSSASGGTGGTSATGGGGGNPTGGDGGPSPDAGCTLTMCGGKCVDTQTDNANCGACGTACTAGTTCQAGACEPVAGAFGSPCTKNGDCNSQLCLQNGHCSKQCSSASDCPPAPEWTCAPLPGYPEMCQCTPSGAEQCDGQDNDCDGLVDNGATCSQTGYTCQNGTCVCDPANLCGATCVDKQTDSANCGTCGHTCAAPESACIAGACACPAGQTLCGGTCIPTDSDPSNCGGCGVSCAATCTQAIAWSRSPPGRSGPRGHRRRRHQRLLDEHPRRHRDEGRPRRRHARHARLGAELS